MTACFEDWHKEVHRLRPHGTEERQRSTGEREDVSMADRSGSRPGARPASAANLLLPTQSNYGRSKGILMNRERNVNPLLGKIFPNSDNQFTDALVGRHTLNQFLQSAHFLFPLTNRTWHVN